MPDLPVFSPGLILLLGALLVPLLRGALRSAYLVLLPLLALLYIHQLPSGDASAFTSTVLRGLPPVQWLRVDAMSKAFGYVFTLNAVIVFIYAFYQRKPLQDIATLIYMGSALGTVFAGDLIAVYINWEIMAIASTFVILANRTEEASAAALRYFLIHVLGGLFFLAGLLVTIQHTGSIAFDGFNPHEAHPGSWLILLGFLVNAAAVPLHAWLPDAYPAASVTGGIVLSAYTTKTAVYTLLRGFPEWEILIWIGCVMTLYGVIYALLENDIRRVLAYSIISQVGFMVCAAGIGSKEAISGAVAHAFCHIIYKSLLWMGAGAVLYRVGSSKYTDLGGLHRTMPWTFLWTAIGALSIAALPFTSGFTSKTIILDAANKANLFWPWIILEIASAGTCLYIGAKFLYYVFFHQDVHKHRPKEAPACMQTGMAILAVFCIYLGCFPSRLYALLPSAIKYEPYTVPHVLNQFQLVVFAFLAFFLLQPLLKRAPGISLDTDWFWRMGGRAFDRALDVVLNGSLALANRVLILGAVQGAGRLLEKLPTRLVRVTLGVLTDRRGLDAAQLPAFRQSLDRQARLGTLPVGFTATLVVLVLVLLLLV